MASWPPGPTSTATQLEEKVGDILDGVGDSEEVEIDEADTISVNQDVVRFEVAVRRHPIADLGRPEIHSAVVLLVALEPLLGAVAPAWADLGTAAVG
ncbi:MAG: hypothetical protein M3411_06070 [Chloroflexota bacterium]|nr:hypothetical protein [Chloroflexota bacterium]